MHRAVPYANRVVVERGDAVQVVGICTDGAETPAADLRQRLDALHVRFPVYRDAGLAATGHAWRTGGTPHWVLADASGVVVDSIFGSEPNRALLRLDYHLLELAETQTIGLGGGCHWCTEAVFESLRGVERVDQGWIRSAPPHEAESEAVLVHFRPREIPLETLIEIHLRTHASTSQHSMRGKYRSAVYTRGTEQHRAASGAMENLGEVSGETYVTDVLPFRGFRRNQQDLLHYYRTRPDAPFCRTYIDPKLAALRARYGERVQPLAPEAPPRVAQSEAASPEAASPEASGVTTWRDVIRAVNHGGPAPPRRVEKPDAEWRAQLSPEAFRVMRERQTEAAHSSHLCRAFEPGTYACVGCGEALFSSAEKVGGAWPTFVQPLAPEAVTYRRDARGGMVRVEALCSVCDAHLGHVSPDGPAPGGLRYCVNGAALTARGQAGAHARR